MPPYPDDARQFLQFSIFDPDWNAFEHLDRMSSVPIYAAASRAGSETILRQIDEWRNSFEHRILVNLLKWRIALEAAREDIKLFETECAENLRNLLFVVVAINRKTRNIATTRGKSSVSSEDDSILGCRKSDDLVVTDSVRVRHIEAEDAQPSRQLAYHYIGDELDISHSRFYIRRGTSIPIRSRAFARVSRTRSTTRI